MMDKDQLIRTIASMTFYKFDADDDSIEDAIVTLNRIIQEAKTIIQQEPT